MGEWEVVAAGGGAAHVGHRVCSHLQHEGEDAREESIVTDDGREASGRVERGEAVEVVGVRVRGEHVWQQVLLRPLGSEELGELLQVERGRLADGMHAVLQPAQAHDAQLLVEEGGAKLRRQQRDVLDDGEAHAPLSVLRELGDGGEERLGEEVDADDRVERVQRGDEVEAHLGELVLEELQEEGEQLLDGHWLAHDGCKAHDDARQRGANMLRLVAADVAHARQHEALGQAGGQELGESGHLEGGCGAHLGLGVMHHTEESW